MPVKPFGVAKRRLSRLLDSRHRASLGREITLRTVRAAAEAGATTAIVTADRDVSAWASELDLHVVEEPHGAGSGLDRAAAAAVAFARGRGMRWAIVHADLPLICPGDLEAVERLLPERGVVLAPSHDGGTNVLAGDLAGFDFAYGPGSFRRHLAAASGYELRILIRPALALDLDTSQDLYEIHKLAEAWGASLPAEFESGATGPR